MRLRVVTPVRPIVDAEVAEVLVPGSEGEFGVLPLHVTFLGGLSPGVLSYVEDGTKRRVVLDGGYAEVRGDSMTILADAAQLPEEIDGVQARAEVARVEEALAEGTADPARTDELLRELALGRARVSVAV